MRKGPNLFGIIGAAVALWLPPATAAPARDGAAGEAPARQAGEDRWVASLAITSGVTIQQQEGSAESSLYREMTDSLVPLRLPAEGDDLGVSPFVGGALELMAPALPIPTRPRPFASAEILSSFAADRDLALDGDPGCVRGPEPSAPCARDEDGSRRVAFGEDAANGQGTKTTGQVETVAFGANLGVAFPLELRGRQLRIKPSVGWINYGVESKGLVVDAECDPATRCTDTRAQPGFLRETVLTTSGSKRFNGIGPGLDVEMDTGRYGPLGVSLFMGGRAYAVVGDRKLRLDTSEMFTDSISDPGSDPPVLTDTASGRFEVEVDPWVFRAHVGIRFHWLGD